MIAITVTMKIVTLETGEISQGTGGGGPGDSRARAAAGNLIEVIIHPGVMVIGEIISTEAGASLIEAKTSLDMVTTLLIITPVLLTNKHISLMPILGTIQRIQGYIIPPRMTLIHNLVRETRIPMQGWE